MGGIVPALTVFLLATAPAWAAKVLVLKSGDANSDAEVQRVLEDRGHTVTVGPNAADFTGQQANVAAFDVTLILYPTNVRVGLPPQGTAALMSYLYGGGRVITTEPFNWETGNSSPLRTLLPAQRSITRTHLAGPHLHSPRRIRSSTTVWRNPSRLTSAITAISIHIPMQKPISPAAPAGRGSQVGYWLAMDEFLLCHNRRRLELQNADLRRLFGNAIDWATVPVSPPPKTADPARVLMLRSGDADADREVQRALEERGHVVTLGPNGADFTGRQASLASFDVTLILYGQNDLGMPSDGVAALRTYILGGGRVITGEPFNWAIGNSSPLRSSLPAQRINNINSPGRTTFARSDPDLIIDEGVSETFLIDISRFGYFEPAPDAKVFFNARAGGPGLLGRTMAGGGRVLSFATPIGALELQNVDFRRLL